MRRRIFILSLAGWLLLSAAALVLGILSYRTPLGFGWGNRYGRGAHVIGVVEGKLMLYNGRQTPTPPSARGIFTVGGHRNFDQIGLHLLEWSTEVDNGVASIPRAYNSEYGISLIWLVALGLLPVVAAYFSFKRGKPRAGICHICGYDLRASTERCPECGSPIQLPGTVRVPS